jgi:hypothetical protein
MFLYEFYHASQFNYCSIKISFNIYYEHILYGISSTLDSQQLSQIIYLPLMFLIRFVVVVVVVVVALSR